MSFDAISTKDPRKMGAGEYLGNAYEIRSTTSFEDGLKVGRFAKWDTAQLDNLDGSATPVIAGVVLRNTANAIEDAGTFTTDNTVQVNFLEKGLVTVEVLTGESPSYNDAVYAMNAGAATDGQAANSANGTIAITGAVFKEEVQTGVWVVELG